MTNIRFCLVVLLLNQMAAAGLAQLEYQLPTENLAESNSADWSGSLALGVSAQFLGNPGGNATINLARDSPSSTTTLFTGYLFGNDTCEGNLCLRSVEEQFFFQVRHEYPLQESKWTGYFQADFDGSENFNRTAFSAGVGFNAYRSSKFELSFRIGVGGFFGTIESEHWSIWKLLERNTITENASGLQGQIGIAWDWQMTKRIRLYGDVDYFPSFDSSQYGFDDEIFLSDSGIEFAIIKSRNIGIRFFSTDRFQPHTPGDPFMGFACVAGF